MKFNKTTKGNNPTRTVTESGTIGYLINEKTELVNRVSTWLVAEPKFYGDRTAEIERISDLIDTLSSKDPEFVAKLAVYCREVLHLRSAPVVILARMSLIESTKPFVRKLVPRICTRADQLTDIIAYLKTQIGDIGNVQSTGSMPCSLKRGLADAIRRMSPYELSKYDIKSEVKLRDVLALTHPTPRDEEQRETFKKLFDGTLEPADTWQVAITQYGSNKEGWEIAKTKMPIFATIRNLANLLKNDVNVDDAIEKISDKQRILKSRIYPHQLLAAYRRVKALDSDKAGDVLAALDNAIEASLDLLPVISGKTIMLADHSYSMDAPISTGRPDRENRDAITRRDAVNMSVAISKRKCERLTTAVFSNSILNVQLNPRSSIIENAESLNHRISYSGTDIPGAIDYFTEQNIDADRIVILTDDQNTNSMRSVETAIKEYRKRVNHNAFLHIVNFVGYGTQSVQNSRLNNYINGFTERFLEIIPKFEEGSETQLKEIEAIQI